MAESNLDGRLESIIEDIINGLTYRQIAAKEGVSLGGLHKFLCRDEHSARVRLALDVSASTYADQAEEVLKECDGTKEELMRARELAQHYRWKAGKRAPKKYGEKLDVTTEGEKISQATTIVLPNGIKMNA